MLSSGIKVKLVYFLVFVFLFFSLFTHNCNMHNFTVGSYTAFLHRPNIRRAMPVTFQSVEEVSICTYLVKLCSPLLCDAGLFSPETIDAWSSLRSLTGKCFTKPMAWWTYEFCFEQHIRQFHVENFKGKDGKRIQSISDDFLLGKYDPHQAQLHDNEPYGSLNLDTTATAPLYFDEGPEPAIVQIYSGGVSIQFYILVSFFLSFLNISDF